MAGSDSQAAFDEDADLAPFGSTRTYDFNFRPAVKGRNKVGFWIKFDGRRGYATNFEIPEGPGLTWATGPRVTIWPKTPRGSLRLSNRGEVIVIAGTPQGAVYAGGGNDILIAKTWNARVLAFMGSGNDIAIGAAANDQLSGGSGADYLDGFNGDDIFRGDDGDDTLVGGVGSDQLYGGNDQDLLDGGAGNDDLRGEDGNDTLVGGTGDDLLWAGVGNDSVLGGDDDDTLYGEVGEDTLEGGNGRDVLYGGGDNDRLYGNVGNDELHGDRGDDVLDGGYGNDVLWGDDGNDTLTGGPGSDMLYGGAGSDVFRFTPYDYDGKGVEFIDTIADFTIGVDKIDLRGLRLNVKSGVVDDDRFHVTSMNGTAEIWLDLDPDYFTYDVTIRLRGITPSQFNASNCFSSLILS